MHFRRWIELPLESSLHSLCRLQCIHGTHGADTVFVLNLVGKSKESTTVKLLPSYSNAVDEAYNFIKMHKDA